MVDTTSNVCVYDTHLPSRKGHISWWRLIRVPVLNWAVAKSQIPTQRRQHWNQSAREREQCRSITILGWEASIPPHLQSSQSSPKHKYGSYYPKTDGGAFKEFQNDTVARRRIACIRICLEIVPCRVGFRPAFATTPRQCGHQVKVEHAKPLAKGFVGWARLAASYCPNNRQELNLVKKDKVSISCHLL